MNRGRQAGPGAEGQSTSAPGGPLRQAPPPEIQGAPLLQTRARDMNEHPVSLMLFVRDGRLSSLEIVWYDESQVTGEFPAPDFWEPPTASSGYAKSAEE
jgi:hypothetical protein